MSIINPDQKLRVATPMQDGTVKFYDEADAYGVRPYLYSEKHPHYGAALLRTDEFSKSEKLAALKRSR